MLKHHNEKPATPGRVTILGASGFLGAALCRRLAERGIGTCAPASKELDLAAENAGERLAGLLRKDDALVMLAALTPDRGRDIATLMKNLRMAEAVCAALAKQAVAHVVYISSDAVYPFRSGLVSEETPAEPADLYAAMHRTRELMFQSACGDMPLAVLRSTLLYGPGDTHNSYGPNRFRRIAAETGKITLGGEGEETRDHMFVDDAAMLVADVIAHRSRGLLNLASGQSETFRAVAGQVAAQFGQAVEVQGSPRGMPVTYRSFDITALLTAFPHFKATTLEAGLATAHQDISGSG